MRSIEKQPQGVTVQTASPNAAMPSTDVSQTGSTGLRNVDTTAVRQPEPVFTAPQEPASGTMPTMQAAAAAPDTPSFEADPRPTAPTTTIWPDPPAIPASIKADDAIASHDPVYPVADTSDSVSRKDERTNTFDNPIELFPAFAFGLVVLGFGLRFLMKRAAARRAQEIVHTEAVTTPTHDYVKPSGNGLADEPTNFREDDFQSFASAVNGGGPLDSVHFASDIGAREARLAQLREDIGQRLGWAEPEQQHSSRQRLAS